jgi:hypothetical protein
MSEKNGDGRGLTQVASGQTGKEYVAKHDLSLHAFYQGRKRLRSIGVLPPARARRGETPEPSPAVRFAKVAVSAPHVQASRLRIQLTNGIAMEWSGVTEPGAIVELIERIRQLP